MWMMGLGLSWASSSLQVCLQCNQESDCSTYWHPSASSTLDSMHSKSNADIEAQRGFILCISFLIKGRSLLWKACIVPPFWLPSGWRCLGYAYTPLSKGREKILGGAYIFTAYIEKYKNKSLSLCSFDFLGCGIVACQYIHIGSFWT